MEGESLMKDRRIVRTRKLLHESLLALMIEKGYEAVTIQHIIDRANVGRSTFYSHFLDKQDLLQSGFDQLKQQLTHQKMIKNLQIKNLVFDQRQ